MALTHIDDWNPSFRPRITVFSPRARYGDDWPNDAIEIEVDLRFAASPAWTGKIFGDLAFAVKTIELIARDEGSLEARIAKIREYTGYPVFSGIEIEIEGG